MDDSVIICDEIIYAEENNFNKEITYKTQNFYILLTFLLIAITLLIAVSIYCYHLHEKISSIWLAERSAILAVFVPCFQYLYSLTK